MLLLLLLVLVPRAVLQLRLMLLSREAPLLLLRRAPVMRPPSAFSSSFSFSSWVAPSRFGRRRPQARPAPAAAPTQGPAAAAPPLAAAVVPPSPAAAAAAAAAAGPGAAVARGWARFHAPLADALVTPTLRRRPAARAAGRLGGFVAPAPHLPAARDAPADGAARWRRQSLPASALTHATEQTRVAAPRPRRRWGRCPRLDSRSRHLRDIPTRLRLPPLAGGAPLLAQRGGTF